MFVNGKPDRFRHLLWAATLGALAFAGAQRAAAEPIVVVLSSGQTARYELRQGSFARFQVTVPAKASALDIQTTPGTKGAHVRVYVKRDWRPNIFQDIPDLEWTGNSGDKVLGFVNPAPGTYFIALGPDAPPAEQQPGLVEGSIRAVVTDPAALGVWRQIPDIHSLNAFQILGLGLAAVASLVVLCLLCLAVALRRTKVAKAALRHQSVRIDECSKALTSLSESVAALAARRHPEDEKLSAADTPAAERPGEPENPQRRRRLGELMTGDGMYGLAAVTRSVVEAVGKSCGKDYQTRFSEYFNLLADADRLKDQASRLDYPLREVDLEGLKEQMDALISKHNPIRFLDLLDDAQRCGAASEPELLDRLDLDRIQVTKGSEAHNLDDFELERVTGSGRRMFIEDILANGYMLRKTGTVLRRPRVRIRSMSDVSPAV